MIFNIIASGSKGNVSVIKSNNTSILIDFGKSKRRVDSGLSNIGLTLEDINAVFFTHEHSDHTSNLQVVEDKEIYAPLSVLKKFNLKYNEENIIKPYKEVIVGDLIILPLPLSHDAEETFGYVISDNKEKLCIITDTGLVTEKNMEYLKDLDYIILESNYDEEMLFNSDRPNYLIQRIISDKGHLSNKECGYYLSQIVSKRTKEVVLGHISQDCNNPSVALSTIKEVLISINGFVPEVKFSVAGQESEVIGGSK